MRDSSISCYSIDSSISYIHARFIHIMLFNRFIHIVYPCEIHPYHAIRDSYDIIFLVKFNVEFPRHVMDFPIKSYNPHSTPLENVFVCKLQWFPYFVVLCAMVVELKGRFRTVTNLCSFFVLCFFDGTVASFMTSYNISNTKGNFLHFAHLFVHPRVVSIIY